MPEQGKELQKTGSMGERFMLAVVQEFGTGVGEVALTQSQRRLAQNYFMVIDESLKKAEIKRNSHKERVPVTWANVNMERLARDVVAHARIGLDAAEKNHVNIVPYKNNATGKYDLGFLIGYVGLELKANKYGYDVPEVIVELVFSNDKFQIHKKNSKNPVEGYTFEITNPFGRGELVGGFWYHAYPDRPEKNKLKVFTRAEIEKRKPKYASAEFWGGEKDIWENGQKVGKEKIEGWYLEMAYKTIARAAYSAIPIDPQKVDDNYARILSSERDFSSAEFDAEYAEHANKEPLAEEGEWEMVDPKTGEVSPGPELEPAPEPEPDPEPDPPKTSPEPPKKEQQTKQAPKPQGIPGFVTE